MTDIDEIISEREERLRMIRDSAVSLTSPDGDLGRVRRLRFSEPGIDRAAWTIICAMGWPGLRLSEEQGGSGMGMAEYAALQEELGRGLLPEPLIEACLVAPMLPTEEREALLTGERLVLPAAIGFDQGAALPQVRDGKVYGEVAHVVLGAAADAWLVACESGLALVEKGAHGLQLTQQPTQDGGHLARLRFNGVDARLLEASTAVLDEAALACAAYLVGLMDSAFERTREYLGVRSQFGQPIGSFQALQHRMVDLKIQIELARAIVAQAATAIDSNCSAAECQRLVSTAKVRAAEAAMLVTRQAIQLHGGIGFTDEADIGLFLRRAMVLLNAQGSLAFHQTRYIALLQREVAR